MATSEPRQHPLRDEVDAEVATVAPSTPTGDVEKSSQTGPDGSDGADNAPDDDVPHAQQTADGGPAARVPSKARSEKMASLQISLLMVALCLSVFLAALDMTIVTTALPTIAAEFHSSAGFAWVGSAFMLASAAATAIWGKVSDIWGRKPVLLAANIVFILGCALCGAAQNLSMLIAGRVVQGIGAGGLLTLVNIIIGDLFSARERGKYYGMIGMVWATAGAMGPVVGGALTNNVSWRWCFYINLPISGTAFAIIFVLLKLPIPNTSLLAGLRVVDWLGALTITGGTLMLLIGLQFGGSEYAWDSPTVICLIVFGVVTLVVCGLIEHYVAKYPVVPTHLYADRSNLAVLLVCFLHGMAFVQETYFLPMYFQSVLGATPLLSGVWLLALSLGVALCASTSGIYLKKTGRFKDPIFAGFVLATLGAGLLYDLPTSRTSPSSASAWARIIIFQAIAGAGVGLNFQPPLVALQSNVPSQNNASATASFALVRNMASAIGVVIGSVSFVNKMGDQYNTVLAAVGGDVATARALTGSSAQANLLLVDGLAPAAQVVVRQALYVAQRTIWIQTVCFLGAGLLAAFAIKTQKLRVTHETVKTGIEGEEERRRIALETKAAKAEKKLNAKKDASDAV